MSNSCGGGPMPWKTPALAEVRLSFGLAVREGGLPIAEAARRYGISRRTAHKWLTRFDRSPATPLVDHSRRPHRSPNRTPDRVVQKIIGIHAAQQFGPRRIRDFLLRQGELVPSTTTIANILHRNRTQRSSNAVGG